MKQPVHDKQPPAPEVAIIVGAAIAMGLVVAVGMIGRLPWGSASPGSIEASVGPGPPVVVALTPASGDAALPLTPPGSPTSTFTPTPTPTPPPLPPTPTHTPTPTDTLTPTPTPTPTLDLSKCNAAGCGLKAAALPTVEYDTDLLLNFDMPVRRVCEECPKNEQLSDADLNALIAADPAALARLRTMALSQQTHEIAPGIVYIVFDNVHHVVVDLAETGYLLRNIIPHTLERGTLITPSYCLSPRSLVVVDADYHGLNGSNKTETGQDLFFHLGRAALFEINGRYDIDVVRDRETFDGTTISWGGGPIFIWDGRYNYNPEQEWFEPKDLEYYRDTRWAKMTVALSLDRKYLFITASYGLTLSEHAQNIVDLGKAWDIDVDRAMRFDGGESTYLAVRLGDYLVPVLNLEEPLIVNCLAIESLDRE